MQNKIGQRGWKWVLGVFLVADLQTEGWNFNLAFSRLRNRIHFFCNFG